MKRIKIFKVYFILWLFVYFIAISNLESFKLYFLSTLTFNIAIVTLLAIGTIMLLRGAKEVVMIAGTFGVLMYKKSNLPFYIRGIEKVLPSNIANKISIRAENNLLMFTQQEKEEILSWIDEQFANVNKYNNFFIGTVLMIGLLGTFSGLLGAIGNMGSIVMSLSGSNIDIGKIMASFSGPLSSMAVGFGSSLFGVISAILLSIKGYLLNRSQASVLDGVENWLNANTVDSVDTLEQSDKNTPELEGKQPSFVDIFAQKMGILTQQVQTLNEHNHELKTAYMATTQVLQNMQKLQYQTHEQIIASMNKMQKQIIQNTQQSAQILQSYYPIHQKEQNLLKELVDLQKDEKYQMQEIYTQIEDLNYSIQKDQQNSKNTNQEILDHIQNKDLNHENNMLLFQLLDAMEGMQKNIVSQIKSIQTSSPIQENQPKEQSNNFFQNHFQNKNTKNQERV